MDIGKIRMPAAQDVPLSAEYSLSVNHLGRYHERANCGSMESVVLSP